MRGARYVVTCTPEDEVYGPFNSLEDAKVFVKEDMTFIEEYLRRLMDKNVGDFREYVTINGGATLSFHVTDVGNRQYVWKITKLKKKRSWGLQ